MLFQLNIQESHQLAGQKRKVESIRSIASLQLAENLIAALDKAAETEL